MLYQAQLFVIDIRACMLVTYLFNPSAFQPITDHWSHQGKSATTVCVMCNHWCVTERDQCGTEAEGPAPGQSSGSEGGQTGLSPSVHWWAAPRGGCPQCEAAMFCPLWSLVPIYKGPWRFCLIDQKFQMMQFMMMMIMKMMMLMMMMWMMMMCVCMCEFERER